MPKPQQIAPLPVAPIAAPRTLQVPNSHLSIETSPEHASNEGQIGDASSVGGGPDSGNDFGGQDGGNYDDLEADNDDLVSRTKN